MVREQVIAHLSDGTTSLVIIGDGGMPAIAYWGAALGPAPLSADLFQRPVVNGAIDVDPPLGIVVEASRGTFGRPGIEGHRSGGRDFAPRFTTVSQTLSGTTATFALRDDHAGLALDLAVALTPSGVVSADATLTNVGDDEYHVAALRLTLPVPNRAKELLQFGGRHAYEFIPHRCGWDYQVVTVENRHGKTGHEHMPVLVAGTPAFSEQTGEVWATHLAWSGNYELIADGVSEARRSIQAGEILAPGELTLQPGERYPMPTLFAAWSGAGMNGISHQFHRYVRSRPSHPKRARPVLMNTWEAVYFKHDLEPLKRLADAGAAVGIERFVLDDGWFHLRRDDRAGLGDWWIDPAVWPQGLTPLIEYVTGLGMEFGIWFEPEMVNPDSDLYRAHPDWALVDERYEPVLGRHQLVLDLGRCEVRDYLFDHISRLLSTHDVAYVKWDHNRDLVAPTSRGRAGVRDATLGVYELLDRLRVAHPTVEFESCASGGGRLDLGILQRTDRVWTSDCIDALDRHAIQRGFSLLFPPELMGAHIGSPICHSTGRRHTLPFRAASALFGHLGIEWNLDSASDDDRAEVANVIALHKELRPLLHAGDVFRGDHPDREIDVHGVIATDRAEALIAVTRLSSSAAYHASPVQIAGLDPDAVYTMKLLDHGRPYVGFARSQPAWFAEGRNIEATGRHLALHGISMPTMNTESTLLLHLTRHT